MKFIAQHDQMDCGPACIAMIAMYYKKKYPLGYLRENCFLGKDGVSLLGISIASEKIGFDTFSAKVAIEEISNKKNLPCILHWNQNHFVVLYDVKYDFFSKKNVYKIADPGYGFIKLTAEQLEKSWLSDNDTGVALFLKPGDQFLDIKPPKEEKKIFSLFSII
ncbi:cysteine peptidase family C39 domain-containing protein [Zunongwangia sp. H14]|uniref:cysteine peptidase family C39 domain-containing protein n=1 Tax=Zunongwangia sp. H14 TaxID=3240792 RepID=UPI003563C8A0